MESKIKQIDIELATTDTKHLKNVLEAQQSQIETLTQTVDKLQSTLYSVMAYMQDQDKAEQETEQNWMSWKRPD